MARLRLSGSLAVLICLFFFAASWPVSARDDDGRDRSRYYGIVESMPEDFIGLWVIGSREVLADSRTEFDQQEGPIAVGVCVKVEYRNGIVHEIDSEPFNDCR